MEIKSIKSKKKQNEIAKELGCSSSILQRSKSEIKLQSLYKSNNPIKLQKFQMTSRDLN